MKSKKIKAIIIGIAVIVIFTGGYVLYNKIFKKNTTATATKFISSTVKTMDISKTIQGTGSAYAGTSSNVAANNSGTVSGLTAKVGDTVAAYQQLFISSSSNLTKAVTDSTRKVTKANEQLTSDATDLTTANTQLATDESTLSTSKAQVATDENARQVNSNKITSDDKAISDINNKITSDEKNITSSTNKISDDKDSVTDANSDLSSANSAVNSQTVTSPIGGLVTAVNSYNGATTQSGKTLLTVSNMNSMKVKVAVDELDISSVAVGQKATINFDAFTDKSYTGTVESIAQTGTTTNDTTTYDVVVSVNKATGIRLGMNANVTIAVKSKDDAVVVPEEALVEVNSKEYVRVPDTTSSDTTQNSRSMQTSQANSKLVEITTGIETQDYIEVTKGVTAGQSVLVQLPSSSSSTTAKRGMSGMSGLGGSGGGTRGSYGGSGSGSGYGGGSGSSSRSGN